MDSEKASLLNSRNTYPNEFITEVNSIDNYMIDKKLDKIDFIKCDVEGFELNALKGAYESVTKFSPDISMEMTSNKQDTIEIINLLKKAGYNKFYKIEKGFPIFDINTHNLLLIPRIDMGKSISLFKIFLKMETFYEDIKYKRNELYL